MRARHMLMKSLDDRRPLRAAAIAACALLLAAPQLACTSEESGDAGPPVASFTESATVGTPGVAIQFTDTSEGGVTSWAWDFGGAAPSTEQNPLVTFDAPGVYTVRLRVSGPLGSSTVEKTDLVTIGDGPVAGFDCLPADGIGYLGEGDFDVICTNTTTGSATEWLWEFGDGATATTQDATHSYTEAGDYTIRLTATSGTESTFFERPMQVRELEIVITPVPPDADGSVPYRVSLEGNDPGGLMTSWSWYVNGEFLGLGSPFDYTFTDVGTHDVQLIGFTAPGPNAKAGDVVTQVVTTFAPPAAAFVSVPETDEIADLGPLTAVFADRTQGLITQWRWDFGDGTGCVFPRPDTPDPATTYCLSASPSHTYTETGIYDVALSVTGWTDAEQTEEAISDAVRPGFVRVYIGDASFESQTPGQPIGAPWESLRPADATVSASHVALPSGGIGAEFGMPSDGARWAQIDGLGTDGQTAVRDVENGLRQSFLVPPDLRVLELDYAFLYAEPPGPSSLRDAMIATVSDGVTEVDVTGSAADPDSPYEGRSQDQPSRDGGDVRGTPLRTASLNLDVDFAGHDPDTPLTLTIRTTNDQSDLRSPLVYVDAVRFVAAASAPIVPAFDDLGGPYRVGDTIDIVNTTCPDGDQACLDESSWRWSFGAHGDPSVPDATGSAEYSPQVSYDARGLYTVELEARRADSAATTDRDVQVLGPVAASFDIVQGEGPFTAPVTLDFTDTSQVDPLETITTYAWDFAGLEQSAEASPTGIAFDQPGTYTIFLTITTSEGVTDRTSQEIVVE